MTEKIENPETKPARRPLWKRLLKWIGVAAAVVAGLFIIICSLAVWILTPDRLTPLVEKQASGYLDADVSLSRVELTFWKTFPRLRVDVDSLRIVSRSLDKLPAAERATLPADADSLLSVRSFHGAVNVVKLLAGSIHLHDVVIDRPEVNLLQVNDSVANYQIVPSSEDSDTTAASIPGIYIDSFRILQAGPLRYRSLADSTDVTARLENVSLDGPDAPLYRLSVDGNADLPFLRDFDLANLTFGLDGSLRWSPDTPLAIAARDMALRLDRFAMKFSTAADFSADPVVTEFEGEVTDLPVEEALAHLPADIKRYTDPLKTDMRLSARVELTRPWAMADTVLPSARVEVSIPRCAATYQTLRFTELSGDLAVDFDGRDMDKSVFDLRRLHLNGAGVNFDLNVKATNVMADPRLDGDFNGSVDLGRIPPRLAAEIPVQLSGTISGETTFRLAMSDLNEENFHRVMADGSLTLRRINANAEGMMTAWLNEGVIEFGTTDSFVRDGHKVDSLLQVSLKVDTLSAVGMGMNLEMKNFKAGAGTVNRSSSADTTEINPFGGSVAVERLKFDAPADSVRARLRDARIGGALTRYKGNARSPLMNLRVFAGRMMFGQALNRVSLRDTEMALTVNLRERKGGLAPRPRPAVNDSIAAERAERMRLRDSIAAAEALANGDVDLTLDREDRRLLRRWDYKGTLRARRGSVTTPWFPLRNRLTNIDLRFNSDSIILTDLKYKAGESDFLINGTISNLRRALTSRRDNILGVSLDVKSDTINVNQIVKAIFAGPALAQQIDSAAIWGGDEDREINDLAERADTAAAGPVLVPHNIDAHFRMRANHILYSDLELERFRGDLLLYDGAINLRNLSASADVGSISLNGLYSSLNPDSLQFGLGMKVDRFRLDRLTALVPAIDTLLPAMRDFAGTVNADIAVTTDLERNMDIDIPSLRAAIKIEGDSLVLLDPDTFKTISKWLLFKDKKKNMIDHMAVEVVVENSTVELYPFMFDIDRYRLGVMGHNDMAMNLNYHVSVLKSPIPFKFGINIKGTPENMKVRLGRAKFKENMVGERQMIADNTRVNLVEQIDNVFRRGVSKARLGRLNFVRQSSGPLSLDSINADLDAGDTLSYTDSLNMIRAGLIENPDTLRFPLADPGASGK